MGAADASRRFAYWGVVVGTLPSRRLAVMSLIGNTSPPVKKLVNNIMLSALFKYVYVDTSPHNIVG